MFIQSINNLSDLVQNNILDVIGKVFSFHIFIATALTKQPKFFENATIWGKTFGRTRCEESILSILDTKSVHFTQIIFEGKQVDKLAHRLNQFAAFSILQ